MAKANGHCHDHQKGLKNSGVVVVMVPFPAQGHLNQLLQLSLLISTYNIPVHFVGTSTHNRQAKLRVHGCDSKAISNKISFHDFKIPSFESPPPDPNSPIKFPSHLQPSFDAISSHLREPVAALLKNLSSISLKIVVVHDSLMASVVQDFVTLPNAESYTFRSISAFTSFWYLWEAMGRPFRVDDQIQKDLPSLEDCFSQEFKKFMASQQEFFKYSSGTLYNACQVMEEKFIDLLQKEPINRNKKLWAIGPLNPVNNKFSGRRKCLEWLDKQSPKSVLFVSFGTTTSLPDEQIKELAIGLERSNVKFIWVLRDADKGDIFSGNGINIRKLNDQGLPKGYEQRVKRRGILVRDWAPQLEILGHPSIGGFMSHCGWNSCMESISNGVPIAAWPMHSDQPRNSVLITDLLKVGIVVKNWASRNELVKSSSIEAAVIRLIISKEGAEIRQRTEELGIAVRKSVAEGGTTARVQLDSFVAHITRS